MNQHGTSLSRLYLQISAEGTVMDFFHFISLGLRTYGLALSLLTSKIPVV